MQSSSSENQKVSPSEKQNLLNKFVELQLAFTLAINEEDRTVTKQERERSNYVKAWLLQGSGHIYYEKMTAFNAELRQLLYQQNGAADSYFQDALWGEATMSWEDDYIPIHNKDAKPGLSSGKTELLSTFLDKYPEIALFLKKELLADKSALTEMNIAIEKLLQSIEGPRQKFVDQLLAHPEHKTHETQPNTAPANNVTSGYPQVDPPVFKAFFENYKNLPPKPLENKPPATTVMTVFPPKATSAPAKMSATQYSAAFYKAFVIANPGKQYNNETEEAGEEFNKVSLERVIKLV